jgi:NADPH2:quinone reductase
MKSIRVHQPGGPEALQYEDVPDPSPGPGELLISNLAAGINFSDVGRRRNARPDQTLGGETVGRVIALGEGVSGFRIGDYVAAQGSEEMAKTGGYSEQVVVNAGRVVNVPAEIKPETVSALLLQALTAHALAFGGYQVKPGDKVLIQAGAGGVGTMLTQMAKIGGAYVFATVGSDEKIAVAKDAGADEVINYSRDDFEAHVMKATDGRGVNAVFDAVGKATFLKGLNCLAMLGTMVSFGAASGAPEPFRIADLRGKYVHSMMMSHHTATREAYERRLMEIFDWAKSGKLRTWVKTYPLARASDAHRDLEDRQSTGKLVLIP